MVSPHLLRQDAGIQGEEAMTTRERLDMWLVADRQLAERDRLQKAHDRELADLKAKQQRERDELLDRR